MSPAEQRAFEAQKRAEWRQARMKSLEADAVKAQMVMRKVLQSETIPEHHETSERNNLVGNEITRTTVEEIDPSTGDRIVRTIEKRQEIITNEIETTDTRLHRIEAGGAGPDIGFMDGEETGMKQER